MTTKNYTIGDWVRVPSEINRVTQIRSTFDMDSAAMYEPIEISETILKDNGFISNTDIPSWFYLAVYNEECDEDGEKIKDYSITIVKESTKYWVKIHKNMTILKYYCNYIHEIQHGLRLAGIEEIFYKININ